MGSLNNQPSESEIEVSKPTFVTPTTMNDRLWSRSFLVPVLLAAFAAAVVSAEPADTTVEFSRDIRPILSDTCFTCHGPDDQQRQADLRLDTRDGLFAERGGYQMVTPEDPQKSRLFQRISADVEAARMPPPWADRQLTPDQIDLIENWIREGAAWERHWAFIPPERPSTPAVKNTDWARNEIDYFVLRRLEREGLPPSHEADPRTLIRRVSLDLNGLPATPQEVDTVLNDRPPNAYENLVDRLLASPRYGERMAWRWLEAARYADSNGYQVDGYRTMWRWRDWVIEAFNNNMPFDQFTIEQLAGDMLPNATLDQKIATGFNRNHRGNGEGGIIDEEYAVEYVVDRVDTTSTVWLGLTMGCARCHDHKYDPITQKEFYELYAFFNNVPEKGRANKYGNSPPMIKAPTRAQQKPLLELKQEVATAEEWLQDAAPQVETAQSEWEKKLDVSQRIDWNVTRGLAALLELDQEPVAEATAETEEDAETEAKTEEEKKKEEKEKEKFKPGFRDGDPSFVPGRVGRAASFDGKRYVNAGDVGKFDYDDRFSLGAWVYLTDEASGTVLSRMDDRDESKGYSLFIKEGKIHVILGARRLDDALHVRTQSIIKPNQWYHLMTTYDGTRVTAGITIYVDGEPIQQDSLLDDLNNPFEAKEPFRIGARGGSSDRLHGYVDEVRIHAVALDPDEVRIVATSEPVNEIVSIPCPRRTEGQAEKLRRYLLEVGGPESIRNLWRDVTTSRAEQQEFIDTVPTTMVMQEMETPRDAFVLVRGAYDKPGEKVEPSVPSIFPQLPAGKKRDRLALAQWLVDPGNPLSARVTVNRFWQMYFGTGLVKTSENFGSQGEPPSHPQLLDWLATEFVDSGWDVKALQKKIVMSATYRQSSKLRPDLVGDPENRLLARGPRFRLSAEVIRDQALAMSGLLVEKTGGPSVRPYQPEGLWKEQADEEVYTQGHGEDLYRRSLYTLWKRTIPPPSMSTFDAASRETCIVTETRTNTPLQALTLMNNVTFVEAARVLAERIMSEGGTRETDRITLAFRLATGRPPRPAELDILVEGFNHHLSRYSASQDEALKLVSAGESARGESMDVSELAAYTAVANLILNLDETVTKE